MDADQVNTLGGFCELIGVGFVARDLMTLARYRGKLAELVARFHAWRAAAVTVMRKLLRRPRPVVCHIESVRDAQGRDQRKWTDR
jgi:hypothetical protein